MPVIELDESFSTSANGMPMHQRSSEALLISAGHAETYRFDIDDSISCGHGKRTDNSANGRYSVRPIFGYAAVAAREVFGMDERLVQLPDPYAMGGFCAIPTKHANVKAWCQNYPDEKVMSGLKKATGIQE